jgi:hypothetical protein
MARSRRAHIATDDLEQALDYLEGLVLILDHFHHEKRGRDNADPLLQNLENMDSHGGNWAPLRNQSGAGLGWQHVGENVAALRRRLLEDYTEAVL